MIHINFFTLINWTVKSETGWSLWLSTLTSKLIIWPGVYPPTGERATIFIGSDEQQHSKQQRENVLSFSAMAGSCKFPKWDTQKIVVSKTKTRFNHSRIDERENGINYPQRWNSIQIDGLNHSKWYIEFFIRPHWNIEHNTSSVSYVADITFDRCW